MSSPAVVLVLGLGRSGVAAARLAAADGADLRVSDARQERELTQAIGDLPAGAALELGGHPESLLDGVDTVVVSPGVPADAPILGAARGRGLTVLSEVEFAWRHRREAPLVAVTGSNGKSTVTVLVAEMLKAAGVAAVAGGNLGVPASELVLAGGWDHWVLEVSSFQTEIFEELRPEVGILLNLSQDHLERHPDMEAYLAAKRRLFARQGSGDVAVLNAGDPSSAGTATKADRQLFSVHGPADACLEGDRIMLRGETILETRRMALAGRHNLANGMAAALAATSLGAPVEAVVRVLTGFEGLAHRHRTVHREGGITWVDDSKATNVGATLAALGGYPEGSVHLILGGRGKGQDFSPLVGEVRRAVKRLYLIGEDAAMIAEAVAGAAEVELTETLDEAVCRSRAAAASGEWVLLAPACASFDQFSSFSERGERFQRLARRGGAPCP